MTFRDLWLRRHFSASISVELSCPRVSFKIPSQLRLLHTRHCPLPCFSSLNPTLIQPLHDSNPTIRCPLTFLPLMRSIMLGTFCRLPCRCANLPAYFSATSQIPQFSLVEAISLCSVWTRSTPQQSHPSSTLLLGCVTISHVLTSTATRPSAPQQTHTMFSSESLSLDPPLLARSLIPDLIHILERPPPLNQCNTPPKMTPTPS